jgi:hypothetical protein
MARRASRTTTDHDEIRLWAEERGGTPTEVASPLQGQQIGIIRIDFPGYGGEGLRPISWDEWFQRFDDANLSLVLEEATAGGQRSSYHELVDREAAEARAAGNPTSRRAAKGAARRRRRRRVARVAAAAVAVRAAAGARARRSGGRTGRSSASRGRGGRAGDRGTRSRSTTRTGTRGRRTSRGARTGVARGVRKASRTLRTAARIVSGRGGGRGRPSSRRTPSRRTSGGARGSSRRGGSRRGR